jgi:hypothetical protein
MLQRSAAILDQAYQALSPAHRSTAPGTDA